LPVFSKGLLFYNELNLQIIQEIENEIKRTAKELDGVKAFREFQLKQMMMVLHMSTHTITNIQINLNKKLADAIDTLRDLPVFGYHD